MTKYLHFLSSLLLLLVLLPISVDAESQLWPLKTKIDLSSGYGDFRDTRFHMGIDLRTEGKIGKPVIAPNSGYIWRVKTSYYGYGKAIYLKGDDNFIYVFAHLAKFSDKIAASVTAAQIADMRYYQDIYFQKDSIRFKKGETMAYSGQTGVGAPHLHFEKRTEDNIPVNPLAHGYELSDKTSPILNRIFFEQVDDQSLFDHARRELIVNLSNLPAQNSYTIDTLLFFNSPFGIYIDGHDKMRPQGMKQSIYKISYFIDDRLYYETVFDSLEFKTESSVKSVFNYGETVNDNKRVRALFNDAGNSLRNNSLKQKDGGIFGLDPNEQPGIKKAKIIALDNFGNKSELNFSFLWGTHKYIYQLDSTINEIKGETDFYFTPVEGYENFKIDSTAIFLNRGDIWGRLINFQMAELEYGQIKFKVKASRTDKSLLRLIVYANKKAVIRDNIFNGLAERGKPNFKFDHEIVEDGLMVKIDFKVKRAFKSRIELYYQDKLLGTEYPQVFNMKEHICFIPPRKEYVRIDKIAICRSTDLSVKYSKSKDVNIYLVGGGENEIIEYDSVMTIHIPPETVAQPRFISVNSIFEGRKSLKHINSDYYEILPEVFVTQNELTLTYNFPRDRKINETSGLCWLDKKEDKWIWLENVKGENTITAGSVGGGIFVVKIDFYKPKITNLNIFEGRTYTNRYQPIRFNVVDTLSGIDDDLDVIVKIDGKWQIVEYDPENDFCQVIPYSSLSNGNHHLSILVTDRAGNFEEQYYKFFVKPGRNRSKARGKSN